MSTLRYIQGQIVELGRMVGEYFAERRSDQSFGRRGEIAAEKFLRRKRYVIVERQMRNAFGEIDIVAVDNRTIVFVEVKTRQSDQVGSPAEAVDEEKQKRITRVALAYLKRNHLLEHSCRFDVIAVTWPADQKRPDIKHYRNAFEPAGRFQMFS